ncbi:MAG: lysoplasmalogenase [Phycisphaerae bacterium]|nr:lysoplasmalogenase [Phycisphaerae bacterium]
MGILNPSTSCDPGTLPLVKTGGAGVPARVVVPDGNSAKPTRLLLASLVGITAICLAGTLVVPFTIYRGYRMPLLMVGSTCYLLIAVLGGGLRSWYGRSILFMLVMCWLGDYLGPGNFYLGLYFFLIGHFALMAAFAVRGLSRRECLISLPMFLILLVLGLIWLYPHVRAGERLPVFAYMLVITAMMVFAGAARQGLGRRLIFPGAMLFYVSDILLARSAFVASSFLNTAFGYPMYYAACVLFALSIFAFEHETQAGKRDSLDDPASLPEPARIA